MKAIGQKLLENKLVADQRVPEPPTADQQLLVLNDAPANLYLVVIAASAAFAFAARWVEDANKAAEAADAVKIEALS